MTEAKIDLEGVIVPLLTPFTEGGSEIDVPALKRLVNVVIDAGVQGVIATSSTGEFFHLDESERQLAAEIVAEEVAGRVPLLVGIGAMATRHVIDWARHARSLHADGMLMLPPFFEPVSMDAIVAHYAAVSDAVDVPIMLYNTPPATQILLSAADIERLVAVANIPWVKLTTGKIELIGQILERLGDRVTLFEGWDTLAFQSMASGTRGWISGPANALPDLTVKLWRLVTKERDLPRSYDLHRKLLPFMDMVVNEGVFNSMIKEVCGLRGYPLGATRAPFAELNEDQRRRVHGLVSDLDLAPLVAPAK